MHAAVARAPAGKLIVPITRGGALNLVEIVRAVGEAVAKLVRRQVVQAVAVQRLRCIRDAAVRAAANFRAVLADAVGAADLFRVAPAKVLVREVLTVRHSVAHQSFRYTPVCNNIPSHSTHHAPHNAP